MEELKVYIAFTHEGDQFDGAVAPNEQIARAMVAYTYRKKKRIRLNGKSISLENFTVRHEPALATADYLLFENAARMSAACAIVLNRYIPEVEDYLMAHQKRLVESKKFHDENA